MTGKWLAIGMVCIALAIAATSVTYHHFRGDRALGYWGTLDGARICRGECVELWELRRSEDSPAEKTLTMDGAHYSIVRRIDVSKAPGLVHARHALIEDATFQWLPDAPHAADKGPDWTIALAFASGGDAIPGDDAKRSVVVFDRDHGSVRLTSRPDSLRLSPTKQKSFAGYLPQLTPSTVRRESETVVP